MEEIPVDPEKTLRQRWRKVRQKGAYCEKLFMWELSSGDLVTPEIDQEDMGH